MTVRPPRLDVARLPTPVRPLPAASARLGLSLWVKHDDDTGGVLSGNKIRKLQYAVHEAIESGADTLVTCGGLQSNHCRATAAIARRLGLHVVLCLRGASPARLEGNLLLDALLGAEITWWTPEQYRDHDAGMADVAEQLRARGRRPYVIAEGCSMPIGSFGYIEACEEIAEAERAHGVRFDAIVHAVGSGGTTAGLELGVRLAGLHARPLGVPVCDDAAWFRPRIAALCAETSARFDLGVQVPPASIELLDGHVGPGYGLTTAPQLRSLIDAATDDGLVLDPVYTSKAWHALHDPAVHERLAGRRVLFVHTGGVFGLAAHADELARAIATR